MVDKLVWRPKIGPKLPMLTPPTRVWMFYETIYTNELLWRLELNLLWLPEYRRQATDSASCTFLHPGYSVQLVSPSSTSDMLVTTPHLGKYSSNLMHVQHTNKVCFLFDVIHPQVLTFDLYQRKNGDASNQMTKIFSSSSNDNSTLFAAKGEFELTLLSENTWMQMVVYLSEYGMVNSIEIDPTTCANSGKNWYLILICMLLCKVEGPQMLVDHRLLQLEPEDTSAKPDFLNLRHGVEYLEIYISFQLKTNIKSQMSDWICSRHSRAFMIIMLVYWCSIAPIMNNQTTFAVCRMALVNINFCICRTNIHNYAIFFSSDHRWLTCCNHYLMNIHTALVDHTTWSLSCQYPNFDSCGWIDISLEDFRWFVVYTQVTEISECHI